MTAEEYVEKAVSNEGAIQTLVRELTGAGNMPEFSSEEITVQDASALIGLPESAIRAGILNGWLPIGVATRNGKRITGSDGRRAQYYIFPRAIWEQTGHVWRGRGKINVRRNHKSL